MSSSSKKRKREEVIEQKGKSKSKAKVNGHPKGRLTRKQLTEIEKQELYQKYMVSSGDEEELDIDAWPHGREWEVDKIVDESVDMAGIISAFWYFPFSGRRVLIVLQVPGKFREQI